MMRHIRILLTLWVIQTGLQSWWKELDGTLQPFNQKLRGESIGRWYRFDGIDSTRSCRSRGAFALMDGHSTYCFQSLGRLYSILPAAGPTAMACLVLGSMPM